MQGVVRLPMVLCCNPEPIDEGFETVCAKCGRKIYPTAGSYVRAVENGICMLCIGCTSTYGKLINGGILHHGVMQTSREAEERAARTFEVITGRKG